LPEPLGYLEARSGDKNKLTAGFHGPSTTKALKVKTRIRKSAEGSRVAGKLNK